MRFRDQRELGTPDKLRSEDKDQAAATYKGGFGFHPLYCFADATGEALAVLLRQGNAAANSIADHVTVLGLDQAIAGLAAEIAAGHREGDDPALVRRAVQVRTDSAGCTRFVHECRARNVGFAVVARPNTGIHAAISSVRFDDDRWRPAIRQDAELRPGAAVAELTDHVDLDDWPSGTRLIVRREPLHPGAQQTLFPSENYRYGGHYADADGDPAVLDAHIRAHARVEDHIRRLKTPAPNDSPSPPSAPTGTGWLWSASPTPSSAGSKPSAAAGPWPRLNRNGSAGSSGTPPPASSATPAAGSSASSTTGPPPPTSSPPTSGSPASPDPPGLHEKAADTAALTRPSARDQAPTEAEIAPTPIDESRNTGPARSATRRVAPATPAGLPVNDWGQGSNPDREWGSPLAVPMRW